MRNGLRTSDFLDDFDELVKELTTRPFKILLLGDFNVHVDISAKPDAVQFMSSLEEAGLQQHVHGSTHKHGHTLDLVISRANNDSFVKYCRVHEKAYSDHHIVSFVLDIAKPETQYITSVSRNYRSLKKEDFETRIADAFVQFPFDSQPDDQTTFFNTAITKVLDDVCPVSERKHKLSSRPAWYTDEIYEARRFRRRLERSWRKSRKCEDYKKYLDQIHILSRLVLEAKSSYYKDQLRDADIKTVFRVLNSLLNRSPSVLPGHVSANDLANRFSAHFNHKVVKIREALSSKEVEGVPVGRIEVDDAGGLPFAIANFSEFETITVDKVRRIIMLAPSKSCSLDPLPVWMLKENIDMFLPYVMSIVKSSLNSGVFPRCLKEAIVTPIIKKSNLDRDNLGNYRPVSNLPFLSKVIEKAVMTQVSEHLESNNLNRDCQSAYRQHHSTETALLKVKNDILQAMDQKRVAFVVLLDLSAAFDSVDHEILLDRLSNVFCIKGTAKSWLDSYLSRRFSRCKVARELSTPQSLDYGVPQGSVVGPQLFSMYTHPLPDIIRLYDGVHSHSYADDVTLYAFAEPKNIESVNRALHTLSSCIDHLQKWMEANMLKLNTEKTEFLVISSPRSRQHIEDVTLAISDISIRPGLTAKNLGMQFDSALKMDSHISDLCRRLHYHLSNLARIRPFIDRKACVDAVRAIISSRLDYGNSLLYGANSSQIQRLQRVQNRAAKLIFKVRKYDHVTPLLRELHWLPIGQRIEFKMLMIVFKCLQGMAPTYLSSLIIPYQSARHGLRSSSDRTILQVPRSNSKSGDNAFMIAGPRLWNELPRCVRLSPSLEVFKKNVKTVLFNK